MANKTPKTIKHPVANRTETGHFESCKQKNITSILDINPQTCGGDDMLFKGSICRIQKPLLTIVNKHPDTVYAAEVSLLTFCLASPCAPLKISHTHLAQNNMSKYRF